MMDKMISGEVPLMSETLEKRVHELEKDSNA